LSHQPPLAKGARSNSRNAMLSATLMPPTQAFFSGSSGSKDILCRRISSRLAE
jgi:hypothetical protein